MKQEGITLTVLGAPRVKKNNQRVAFNGRFSTKYNTKTYADWELSAFEQLAILKYKHRITEPITGPINLRCIFYMPTRGRVDLSALYEGIQDVMASKDKYDKAGRLKRAGLYILEDDNYKVVAGHDGSRVRYDKENPRMEITITPMKEADL